MLIASDQFRIVVGLGKSGMSLVRHLARRGLPFAVVDTRANPPELATLKAEYPDVQVRCGELDVNFLCTASELLVSPGLAVSTPALQEAAARGVKLSGDIELFAREAKAPIVAITGSNAKSTVTTLVGEMAAAAGRTVAVGGNLGTPALDLLADDVDLYVLEHSSFQLETTEQLNAEVATCLNISEDHMDRYSGLPAYHQAKHRIFRGARQVVVNRDDRLSRPLVGEDVPTWTFGLGKPDFKGFGLFEEKGEKYLAFQFEALMPVRELKMRGAHNQSNALAALALGHAVGLPFGPMLDTLRRFTGLPHRCQWVGERAGVSYYDDSKATNVGAALAAIEGLGADILAHVIDNLAQACVALPRRMHEARKQFVDHVPILPAPGAFDHAAAASGRLRRVGARLGAHQRQFRDPLGCLPHDLEGDVAAHRMAGEGKARRCLSQDTAGDRPHIVVPDMVGDRDRAAPPQRRDHRGKDPRRADEARDEQDRHRIVHAGAPDRVIFGKQTTASRNIRLRGRSGLSNRPGLPCESAPFRFDAAACGLYLKGS